MKLDRRQFLLGALGAGGALALGSRQARAAVSTPRPRTYIQFFVSGGLDALLTTDPRVRGDVQSKVELTYGESEILQRPLHRLGPLFAPLGAYADRFAILNGVECSTVAHPIGQRLIRQMRRSYVPGAPSLGSLIGVASRERRPFDEIRIGDTRSGNGGFAEEMLGPQPRNLAWLTADNPQLFDRLWALSRDGVRGRIVRDALALHAGEQAGPTERAALEATAALLAAMPSEAPPKEKPKAEFCFGMPRFFDAADVQSDFWDTMPTLLWLMKHRLATSFFFDVNCAWDSHMLNQMKQNDSCSAFVPFLKAFLKGLDETLTPEGSPLSSEVVVVVSSELGRFPFLNPYGGKDHLPELPVLVAGPGIRPGQYGHTNDHMVATPILRSTGKPGVGPGMTPVLEDMGATLLALFGERDATRFGYLGDPLDFLLA